MHSQVILSFEFYILMKTKSKVYKIINNSTKKRKRNSAKRPYNARPDKVHHPSPLHTYTRTWKTHRMNSLKIIEASYWGVESDSPANVPFLHHPPHPQVYTPVDTGQPRGPFTTWNNREEETKENQRDTRKRQQRLGVRRAARKMLDKRKCVTASAHVLFCAVRMLRNIYCFLREKQMCGQSVRHT